MPNTTATWLKPCLIILFFFSGFTGLVYEAVWAQYLRIFCGHAAYAQTTTLALFMGGLGLGAWLTGQYASRIKNPLQTYLIIELIIGLYALSFHSLYIFGSESFYAFISPHIQSPLIAAAAKLSFSALMILPATLLMGATFPLISLVLIRLFPKRMGNDITWLYFSNSLGAAIGVLITGFYLIANFGLPGALRTAAYMNLAIAIAVMLIQQLTHSPQALPVVTNNKAGNAEPNRLSQLLILTTFSCGVSAFLYEVGWIRMLSLVLGSTTHAFELMLSAFIFGIAIGSYIIRQKIDEFKQPITVLLYIQAATALCALTTIFIYGQLFEVMQFGLAALSKTDQGYTLFNAFGQIIAMAFMIPTTLFSGMALPLITHILLRQNYGERAIGHVMGANTIGAIFGVVIAIHLIMPLLGLKWVIGIGVGINLILAIALALHQGEKQRKLISFSLIPASIFAMVLTYHYQLDPIKMSSGVYRNGTIYQDKEILFHRDGKTASIDVFRTKSNKMAISTNGKPDATLRYDGKITGDDVTTQLVAALPWAIKTNAKKVGIIGLGSGRTTHTFLTIDSIEQVDTIEIEPAMVEGAKLFGSKVSLAFTDPRSNIIIEDARTWFSRHRGEYDIIVSEPSNPWVSGVSSLFTTEFYQRIPQYLSDDGLFVQWIQLYEFNGRLLASIVKSLSPHFDDYAIYASNDVDIFLVARKNGKLTPPLTDVFEEKQISSILKQSEIAHMGDLMLRYIGSKELLDPYFQYQTISSNSDYYPSLENQAGKSRFLHSRADELHEIMLSGIPLHRLENRPLMANQKFTHSLIFKSTAHALTAQFYAYYFSSPADEQHELFTKANGTMQQHLENLNQLYGDCSKPINDAKWINSFKAVISAKLTFLPDHQQQPLLRYLADAPCWPQASDQIRHWAVMYQALVKENYPVVLELSSQLINNNQTKSNLNYLVSISMFSQLMLDDYRATLASYEQQRQRGNKPDDVQQLLSSLAYEKKLRHQRGDSGTRLGQQSL